jgi:hypothetical protein
MVKPKFERTPEALRAIESAMNNTLGLARTHRMLFATAYAHLATCIEDVQVGIMDSQELMVRASILKELMAVHTARIRQITAVASPSVGPRVSELER